MTFRDLNLRERAALARDWLIGLAVANFIWAVVAVLAHAPGVAALCVVAFAACVVFLAIGNERSEP